MIDIEFRIGGRKVWPNQIANELEKAMLTEVRDGIAKKLRGVRDPETGKSPKIIMKGRSLSDLSVEVSGSESLIAEVKRRLS